jgi:hypothetical protein
MKDVVFEVLTDPLPFFLVKSKKRQALLPGLLSSSLDWSGGAGGVRQL